MASISSTMMFMLALVATSGCATKPEAGGRSSFQFEGAPPSLVQRNNVEPEASAPAERLDYIPAHARRTLAEPVYPAAARRAGAGDQVLFATMTVDAQGRIVDLAPSWNRVQLAGPAAGAFWDAIRTAVASWDIEPAREVHYRRGADGQDEYEWAEPVPETFEVKFSFDAGGTTN